jgi:phosphate transport system protein
MPREAFERQLRHLQEELLVLGSMVEEALADAVRVLMKWDAAGAQRLIAGDQVVNERRYAIEGDALTLIATQQPMAGDLRTLAAVLEIATELERIGDYAKGIARISLMIGPAPLLKPAKGIPAMADKAIDMLRQSLDAFVRRDATLARSIPSQDDVVDDMYNQVYQELIACVVADPSIIDQANRLLWAAHNLERAADRVTNICERVLFTVTGEMMELDQPETGIESLG